MSMLVMRPTTGDRLLRFVGDTVEFTLCFYDGRRLPSGWRAFLRTNLGRAKRVREEIIRAYTGHLPIAGASWRDIPLAADATAWHLEMPVHEVGYFKAKAYAVDASGRQYWPEGPDVGISIHPNAYRTANSIYCAFVRLFGPTRKLTQALDARREQEFKKLDAEGYTVIPASGKLRDLTRQVPHIIHGLGCRILHLLPINPTPTTYARFGRYGSPYAALDFRGVDAGLVEFDRRSTGVDQFRELADAVHGEGGKLFLDLAINHTGWGSVYLDHHPEWFVREASGLLVSPGAWGTTWEDLCELSHRTPDLWDDLAEAFLLWCQRGVDGFRCDAGYKVPLPAWQYLIAKVREEFPETIFLLEGLGGAWEVTEQLLTEGGMQWAYSELFQNYSAREVSGYLDYSLAQSQRLGLWVHYSETHDNTRLAAKGRAWSLLRNRLCALTSVSGGFGFTCGVEWLASERIQVHQCTGLSWEATDNMVSELRRLNTLLADHPCFFDGAKLTRISPTESPVYALRRQSYDGADQVLVVVNTDIEHRQTLLLSESLFQEMGQPGHDLLGQPTPPLSRPSQGQVALTLDPAAAYCLAASVRPRGASGKPYREARELAAWAITQICRRIAPERYRQPGWLDLAKLVEQLGPHKFLTALDSLDSSRTRSDLVNDLRQAASQPVYPRVIEWHLRDAQRLAMVPPDHWLLVWDTAPFQAILSRPNGSLPERLSSIAMGQEHLVCFAPGREAGDAELELKRFAAEHREIRAQLRYLAAAPQVNGLIQGLPGGPGSVLKPTAASAAGQPLPCHPNIRLSSQPSDMASVVEQGLILLTNGRGGMARLGVDLGRIQSKYDCLLAANLHSDFPIDRQVLAKRARVWLNADGFLSPLDQHNLLDIVPGPPARWKFVANAGDGRTVEVHVEADMLDQRNATVLRFSRPPRATLDGEDLPEVRVVRLTVRVDIEDRNFHGETQRNEWTDSLFPTHTRPLTQRAGFEFTPALDRRLRVFAYAGFFHPEPEWCQAIAHPIEQSRGQVSQGAAYSPGWFDLPLAPGEEIFLVVHAEAEDPAEDQVRNFIAAREQANQSLAQRHGKTAPASRSSGQADTDAHRFAQRLLISLPAYVARRGRGRTVIAGYPWFLDWGRDTLICARGLLAVGMVEEVNEILETFGQYEHAGTLPNSIHGADVSNRDTSDAPLWFALVCEEMAALTGPDFYATPVGDAKRTLGDVLHSIARHYVKGTPNGIHVDPSSGLVWSPRHFTWMDTNYPAATPREGYPVEIQVLWIRLLRQLNRHSIRTRSVASQEVIPDFKALAHLAETSFLRLFWLESAGYLSDVLLAGAGTPAANATADNALRCNFLLAISLGIVTGRQAQQSVGAAIRHLIIPGAVRSLAPLPVSPPLPVYAPDGRLLNKPDFPYAPHYEGDEDTQRKPAYHNGTAWTWMWPVFCEALVRAWDGSPFSVTAAKAYLGSVDRLLQAGCLGHLPEILDGDAPHRARGCDAQAWGMTEAFRVWRWLETAELKPH